MITVGKVDNTPCLCDEVAGPHGIFDFHPGLDDVPDDEDECEGHESLRGDLMGASFFCPNNECVK